MADSRKHKRLWFAVLLCLGAACSVNQTPSAAPTRTLIPATITDTPTPVPPTATRSVLPAPDDIAATPAPALVPAAAQPLVSRAIEDLATTLEIERENIELALIEAATWTDRELGCNTAGLPDLEEAIEGYRLVLLVGDTAYEYHTDSVDAILRCGREGADVGETDLLMEIDPVAAELVALAQRRLSQQLNVPVRRVRVLAVTPYTWTDSSLGCPLNGQDYLPLEIDGYRIVLSVDEREYIFHTDFDRLFSCDAENEVLPDDASG